MPRHRPRRYSRTDPSGGPAKFWFIIICAVIIGLGFVFATNSEFFGDAIRELLK